MKRNNLAKKALSFNTADKRLIFSQITFIVLIFCLNNLVCGRFANNLFHTNEEIFEGFDNLLNNCASNIVKKYQLINDLSAEEKIPYYSIQSPEFKENNKNANIVFLLFGEHPREIIPTEESLFLANTFCNKIPGYDKETIKKILKTTKLYILPIFNIPGRNEVVKGEFCKRTNFNNVDLNRNWDSHWKPMGISDSPISAGKRPFSEWETNKLKEALTLLKPKTFISTHSGSLGMFSPYAYKKFSYTEMNAEVGKQLKNLQKFLLKLNKDYCQCTTGSIGNDLGYLCPGTCLDYAFDEIKSKYAFAFEIYSKSFNSFYKNILDSDNLPYFNYDTFIKKHPKNSLKAMSSYVQMQMKSLLKLAKLEVMQFKIYLFYLSYFINKVKIFEIFIRILIQTPALFNRQQLKRIRKIIKNA